MPEQAAQDYDRIWNEIATIVRAGGGHAWRFSSSGDPGLRLEFLEYEAGNDPRGEDTVAGLLSALDARCGSATTEEWLEDR